jgi:hypothetical protein
MNGKTSIGTRSTPSQGDAADQATIARVDAQRANEADMHRGLAGAENKVLAKGNADKNDVRSS